MLGGREAGRPQSPDQTSLSLHEQLPLEDVRPREAARIHHPLKVVSSGRRGWWSEPSGQVKRSGLRTVTGQRRGCNGLMSVKQLDVSVATITSTWKPRVLLHHLQGRRGIRMHVKVGVGVGGDLQRVVMSMIMC